MTQQGSIGTADPVIGARGTFVRAPGVRLLGRYEGAGYVEPRYLVVRADGQTIMLTRLLYLAVQYADARLDPSAQAQLISREYGRLLPVDQLGRLVRGKLAPAGLVAYPDGPAGVPAGPAPARSRPLLAVAMKASFVPVPVVRRIARWLAPAFHPAAVAAVLAAFLVCEVWLITLGSFGSAIVLTRPGDLLTLLGLVLAATLLHEFGHAAGCHYGGGRPGAIGAGLYLWVPVFWTEVTDAYRLDRRGRLRTDLGGIYFNALFIVLATGGFALTGWAPLAAAALVNNVFIPQQLIPFVRLDGYYLLGDLTGVPNLFGLVGPILRSVLPGRRPDPRVDGLRRGTRIVVTVWVIVTVLALVASLALLIVGMPALVGSAVEQVNALWRAALDPSDAPLLLLAWISMLVVLLPFLGLGVLVARVGRLLVERRRERSGVPAPSRHPEAIVAEPSTTDAATGTSALGQWFPERPVPNGTGTSEGGDVTGDADPDQASPTAEPPAPAAAAAAPKQDVAPPPAPKADTPPDAPPLSAASFTEETMLRPHRTPPERGVRRTLFLATGGRIDLGPSAAERRRAELVERIRRPVTTCRRIVVLSRKGGAGKTTTTLMLGHVLAMNRADRVVALDANPDAGSLPYRVVREGNASITSLLAEVDRLTSYAEVRAHTSQTPTRLEIVASDDDPRISHAMGRHDYRRAIELLDRHFMLILLDTGTGILDDAIQGILAEADQIVVVMPPALDGARVAASTLDWLGEHGYGQLVRGAVAVINGIRGDGGLVQLDQIERHFAARCSAVVRIPWDRCLEAGARTGPQDLRHRTLDAYLELAAAVADGFALPGRQP